MSDYDRLTRRLVGITFVLAPLLMVIGATVFVLGIEISQDGTSSWIEGIFLAFGFLMMVPVLFELSRILGQRAPRFGLVCAITGLGIGIAVMPGGDRIMQEEFALAGINQSIWALTNHAGWIPIVLWMFLGMFTPLLLGIGFLRKGGIPRGSAILLALAPILFVIGQGGDETIAWWQNHLFYPLATLTFLAALAPLGLRYLSGAATASDQERVADPSLATG